MADASLPSIRGGDPDVARAWRKSPRRTVIELMRDSNLDSEDIATLAGVPIGSVEEVVGAIPEGVFKGRGRMTDRPDTGVGGFVEGLTGSIRAGETAQTAADYLSAPAKATVETFQQGTRNIGEGVAEGDPLRVGGGALQTGLTVAPGTRAGQALFRTVPRALGVGGVATAADVAGSGRLSDAMAEEEQQEDVPGGDVLQGLYQQRSTLEQRRTDASKDMQAEAQTGKGQNWRAARDRYDQLTTELEAVNQRIDDVRHRQSPEYQEELKKRKAQTPFREKYPAISDMLVAGGLAASAGLPFALRVFGRLGSFMRGSSATRINQAVERAESALSKGDDTAAEIAMRELDDLVASQPKAFGEATKAASAALAGGALTAETSMIPDQYDAINLPEGEDRSRARERALDPLAYGERGLMGTLTGLSGYKAGAMAPARTPDLSRARAVSGTVRDRLSPSPTQVPFRSGTALEEAEDFVAQQQAKRSAAAKKGWETRRAKEEARKRSEAAKKGWEKRKGRSSDGGGE